MCCLQSATSRIHSVLLWATFCLWVSVFGAGCRVWGDDVVKIRIVFTETDPAKQLTDLAVFSGADKYSWYVLAAGEAKTINLLPGPRNNRQLVLLYTLDGEKKSWEGPKFPFGTGYRIEVKIDARGTVASRHCVLPCSLD